ncbi:hypothetical protein ACQW08_05330 [Gluconobacter japonicus]|uniref:Y-family DNA polymerase n=1 Tax=Gluconobacter TaxID=441 RepID=UPI003CFB94F7
MPIYGLIDGNSFYCSCQPAFESDLKRKPVVVLSNNDGCAIARTREAKELGIKMGNPWHFARKRPEAKSVVWYSSNYALYADMSRRMYEVLQSRVPSHIYRQMIRTALGAQPRRYPEPDAPAVSHKPRSSRLPEVGCAPKYRRSLARRPFLADFRGLLCL